MIYERVKAYIEEHGMLSRSDCVIAGISGGADSVCLLCLLLRLKKEYGFRLIAVHVNHLLRGEEARKDEEYVKEFCAKRRIPLKVCQKDVRETAKRRKLSLEEAGREVRRESFERVMEEQGGTKIALAHHMDDNAETLFLNIARGTGLKGAGGMLPVNGAYIRPLLGIRRYEIEKYLKERKIEFCIDGTNLEDVYTRNKIRAHILPYLQKEINERAVEHAAAFTEEMRGLYEYLEGEIKSCGRRAAQEREDAFFINKEAYGEIPKALRAYVLKDVIVRAAGKSRDISARHIRAAASLFEKPKGKQICLPGGLRAVNAGGGVLIERAKSKKRETPPPLKASCRLIKRGKMEAFAQNPYTKWFDYDIIKNNVEIRNRRAGDYITIDKEGHTQKLKKYFINAKIPKGERDALLVAADGSHIMWVIGYRQNQAYQVTERTRRILEIRVNEGEEDDDRQD